MNFNPQTDPFDPTQEKWKGWERREICGCVWWYWIDELGLVSTQRVLPVGMVDGQKHTFVGTLERVFYAERFIPHATVVSILHANGYVPEVEG